MAARKLPDVEFVRECLDYDPATGVFTWRERPLSHFDSVKTWKWWNVRWRGTSAGSIRCGHRGVLYWSIGINHGNLLAHRLAWLLTCGADPWPLTVDHINGNSLDNRFSNLRLATQAEQMANIPRQTRGTFAKGVGRNGRGYQARISVAGERIYLGTFSTPEEAAEARRKAAITLHGEFARNE